MPYTYLNTFTIEIWTLRILKDIKYMHHKKNLENNTTHKTTLTITILFVMQLLFAQNSYSIENIDKTIAIVGEDIIFASELERRITQTQARLKALGRESSLKNLRTQLLEQLILERLQLDIAKKNNITANPDEIERAVERTTKNLESNGSTFQEYLRSQNLTEQDALLIFSSEIIIDKVQNGVINQRVNITDREVENFLSSKEGQEWLTPRYTLGHIFLPSTEKNKSAVMRQAKKIHASLKKPNTDFKQAALKWSKGPNASKGGDLGSLKKEELPPLFISQIDFLEDGDVSSPFHSDAGVHILKLYQRKGAKPVIVDQYNVRHILVKTSELFTEEEAKNKISLLYTRLLNGENFNDLAQENTDDIASKLNGGSLGWSKPGLFVPEFESAMQSTAKGEFSKPFSSQFGWHILYIDDTRKKNIFEDVKNLQVKNLLRRQRFQDELQIWLQELRDNAYVEILN